MLEIQAEHGQKIDRAQVAGLLRRAGKILVLTHYNPDGDAIGSLAAVGRIAAALGKDFRLYCHSPVPYFLEWVELPGRLYSKAADLHDWRPDLTIFLDCGALERGGPEAAHFISAPGTLVLNIDHHQGNSAFGHYNWLEPARAATAEMAGLLAEELALPLAGKLGEAVYLGLVSDSGNFSYGNTGPELLELAARIVRAGLDVGAFNEKYSNNWTEARIKLWGVLLQELLFLPEKRLVVSVITSKHHKRFQTSSTDLEGFVSFIRRIKGADISLLVSERLGGGCKISLRSAGETDIRQVAERFGGGGHRNASGAELPLPPDEALKTMLGALEAML